jgi:hypothetical protein
METVTNELVGNLLNVENRINDATGKSTIFLNTEKGGSIRFLSMTKEQLTKIASTTPNWRANVEVRAQEARTITMEDGREVDFPAGHYCFYSNTTKETLDI